MISVTTNKETAIKFAELNKYGKVYEAELLKSQSIKQTLEGAGEDEYLIKFFAGGFKEVLIK